MRRLFYDTETNLIRPGLAIPELICVQSAVDDAEPIIRSHVDNWRDVMHEALFDRDTTFTAHYQAFDLCAIGEAEPDFVQPIFRMLAAGRARDTMIAETLIAIRDGNLDLRSKQRGSFALGTLSQKYCGVAMDKEGGWRTAYATLKGLSAADYPEEALEYCRADVVQLRAVQAAQKYESPDEWMQCCASFALALAAAWGVRTDPEKLLKLEAEVLADQAMCERVLTESGFFRDGSVNKKAVQAAVEKACAALDKPVPRTKPTELQLQKWKAGKLKEEPTGSIKTDADTIESIKDAEPNLKRLSQHTTANGDAKRYLSPLKSGMHRAMNSRPNVLVSTGRTSWGGSKADLQNPWEPIEDPEVVTEGVNLQNLPRREGVRDCIVPRAGMWWCSVDYDSLELRTLAQVLLWVTGRSNLASRYAENPDYDPHTDFASHLMGISYSEAMALKKAGDKTLKRFRQGAKAALFGLPGGLGVKRFVEFSAKSYGYNMTLDEASELKARWLEFNPEMAGYFAYINWLVNAGKPLKQFVSGRVRGDVGYCDGCNSTFQALAADGAKRALFVCSMATYAEPLSPLFGSRIVAFIHDEICAEVPIATAHEAAMEMVRLMEREMSTILPDVPVRASPALSTAWIKAAEAKYDANGRLTAWDL